MTRASRVIVSAGLAWVLLQGWACSGTSTAPNATTNNTGNTTGVSFSRDIQPIFDQNCVVCHQGQAAQAPGGLVLASGSAYGNLVNVKSTESPLTRVVPGHAEQSYIMAKLSGNQTQVGGTGAQMPFGQQPLTQDKINLIQQWISAGAQNN